MRADQTILYGKNIHKYVLQTIQFFIVLFIEQSNFKRTCQQQPILCPKAFAELHIIYI